MNVCFCVCAIWMKFRGLDYPRTGENHRVYLGVGRKGFLMYRLVMVHNNWWRMWGVGKGEWWEGKG